MIGSIFHHVYEIFYRKELVVQIPHGQLEEITHGKSRVVLRDATMALNKKSNELCEVTVFDNTSQYSLILDHKFDFKLPIVRDERIVLKWRDNRHTFEFIARQDDSSLFSKLVNSLQESTRGLDFSSNTVDENPREKEKADPAPKTVQHGPPITHGMHFRQSGSARRTTSYEPPESLPESPSDIESYSSDEEGEIFEKRRYAGHSDDNLFTVVGSKNTFGFRGSVIDVYNTNGSELLTDIYIETNHGNLIKPSDAMLYRSESQLLLWEKNPSTIFVLDLHKGKVVDKWNFGKTFLDILVPKSKFASQSDTQELLGASSHALFRIDPRDPRKIIPGFSYLQKNVFSCMATTEHEAIAAGSLRGDIRMYNDSSKRAKTHVPIPGNEISSICTSANGQWILATCPDELLLLDSRQKGETLGFNQPFPKESKPKAKRLTLSGHHVALLKKRRLPVCFTPAYFDKVETTIITSTGPFLITWNLKIVSSGRSDLYTLTEFDENIMASDCTGKSKAKTILVTQPSTIIEVNLPKASGHKAKVMKPKCQDLLYKGRARSADDQRICWTVDD